MNWIVGILSSTIIVVGVAAGLLYYAIDSFMEIPIDGNIFDDNDEYEDDYGEKANVKLHYHTNEPWLVLAYCRTLGEIYDIVVEDMDRQARGLQG